MYRYIKATELKVQKSNNYIYFIDKAHPLGCGNSGKVYYHRHVASIKEGRWLTSEEHVHHIDEDKQNNAPSNLKVLSSQEHTLLHLHDGIQGKVTKVCTVCNGEFQCIVSDYTRHICSTKCVATFNIKDKSLTRDVLDKLIPNTSWVVLGKMFGYSDNGIKKRAIALGCNIKELKSRSGPKD